jgi:hypothetical protein
MSITVIISHYAPPLETRFYRNILKNTINSVRSQEVDFDVEIIVCDDGSAWSRSLSTNDGITDFDRSKIKSCSLLDDLNVDRYLLLPDVGNFRKAAIQHRAIELASNEKIVMLDDDNYFIKKDSLARYYTYLDKYNYVCGRLIGPPQNGSVPKLYLSKNTQGTNFGLRKELYFSFGGYPEFLFINSMGEDDVLLWLIYSKLKELYPNEKKACFAGEIETQDLITGRWVSRNQSSKSVLKEMCRSLYGIDPNRNPSRNKLTWMELPSGQSWKSEGRYFLRYFLSDLISYYRKPARRYLNQLRYYIKFFIQYSTSLAGWRKVIYKVNGIFRGR